MKQPGPDHPIAIQDSDEHVRIIFAGRVVANSTHPKLMEEKGHAPVAYIPREDADASILVRTDHSSHCPYKGDASYYSIKVGDRVAENAIWTYEQPYPAVAEIAGHLAFYPSRVDKIEIG